MGKKRQQSDKAQLMKSASQGLLLIDEQLEQAASDYARLQEKQREIQKKLANPNSKMEREELEGHAMEMQIMLANQESVTKGLEQSKKIIIDYLQEDGREALVAFFKIRKIG